MRRRGSTQAKDTHIALNLSYIVQQACKVVVIGLLCCSVLLCIRAQHKCDLQLSSKVAQTHSLLGRAGGPSGTAGESLYLSTLKASTLNPEP